MKRKMPSWLSAASLAVATFVAQAQTVVEYIHTDALGTPVAVTDANQNVVERSEYEPYGRVVNRPPADGPGYTAHVSDSATGLSYMQQRYFDPEMGRFISVDPVMTDLRTGGGFGRYTYALSNPYRFTDPDGRCEPRTGTRICYNPRKFTVSDISIVQSYDAVRQIPAPLPEGSNKVKELSAEASNAARALNRAGRELGARGLNEHVEIFNKMKVFMTVEDIKEAKAFATKPPVYDLVVGSRAFSQLWTSAQIGLMLHEIHHFTAENIKIYNMQVASGSIMGTGTPYEDNAFIFQKSLGYGADEYKNIKYDKEEEP